MIPRRFRLSAHRTKTQVKSAGISQVSYLARPFLGQLVYCCPMNECVRGKGDISMGLRNLVLLSVGTATMWLPIHYSFYRYSIIGDDGIYYPFALLVMLVCCGVCIARRAKLAAWLARRPPMVLACSMLTLASNGLLMGLPFLPLDPALAQLLHLVAVGFYSVVFVLLFFAWTERMGDVMFQLPIVSVTGMVGVGICVVFLLVNFLFGTSAYQIAATVCLAVSGACWQACGVEAVSNEGGLSFLPSGKTLREWSLLLVAFGFVTLLHAVTFAGGGQDTEQSGDPTWLLHAGFIVLLALFLGLLCLGGGKRPVSSQSAFTLVVAMVIMMYEGLLITTAAPGVLSDPGHLATHTVVSRTLRVFIFLVLMTMCYRDAASPVSTFGLLFLMVEIVGAFVCYQVAPALFQLAGIDPDMARIPVSSVTALVLCVVLAAFFAMHIAGQGGVVLSWGMSATQASLLGEDNRPCADDDTLPEGAVDSHEVRRRSACQTLADEYGLTGREGDIMYYLSLGFSVKKIADILCISANTVSTHSARLYRKLGVHARQELIDAVDAAQVQEGC